MLAEYRLHLKFGFFQESTAPSSSNPKTAYKFQCGACEKKFKISSELTRHYRIHTGEKPYECKVCHMKFMESGDLGKHMRRHTGERKFCCEVCGNRFSCSGTLKKHMLIHTGEKPHECEICKKKFRHSNTLKGHMLTHTGEKPYECKECDAKFSDMSHLVRHNRSVHNEEKASKNCSAELSKEKAVKNSPMTTSQTAGNGKQEQLEPLLRAKEEN